MVEEQEPLAAARIAAAAARVGELEVDLEQALAHAARVAEPPHRWTDEGVEALVIATACLDGDPRGFELFEARYMRSVAPALDRLGLDHAAIADVKQRVRMKLFVDEAQPAIFEYLGKGDLRAFLRVVATRLALSLHRAKKPTAGMDALAGLAEESDPQLELLAEQNRHAVRGAIEEAAATLTASERVLLRLHHVDALTVDEIGRLEGVHRSTAARRIAKARARLVEAVHGALRTELELGDTELDSLMRGVQSQLDVSLSRILRDHSTRNV